MKRIRLHLLQIKNFKGIKDFRFEPKGNDAIVLGTNATGKTTLKDALSWLFTGKDSNGKADFQLKPVDKSGNEIHKLEVEVEAKINVGLDITLKKRFYEKWVKTRGKAIKEFSGHTTDHFVDGVPCQKKEFDNKIADMMDIEILPLFSDTEAFNQLHWEKRRDIVLTICGAMTDKEVILTSPEFSSLKDILQDSTIHDHRKKLLSEQKEINKELDSIPARVSENQNNIIEAEAPKAEEYSTFVSSVKKKQKELAEARSNEATSKKQVEINQIDIKVANLNQDYKNAVAKAELTAKSELLALKADLDGNMITLKHDLRDRERFLKLHNDNLDSLVGIMIEKRAEWQVVFKTDIIVKDTCPTCKQSLPAADIEAAIEELNVDRAKRLKIISQFGKDQHAKWVALKKDSTAICEALEDVKKTMSAKESALKDVEESLSNVAIPKIEKPDTKKLYARKEKLEKEITKLKQGSAEIEATINEKITVIEDAMDLWKNKKAAFVSTEKAQARVNELEAEEVSLGKKFEDLAKELDMLDQFIIKKVEMSEKQINDHFTMAKFKLFDIQINGGVKECCRTIYDGVPFNRGLNNGAKINVGLDIIDTLSKFYKFSMPVFIDNAESCTSIRKSDTQLIKLVVDKSTKALTVKGE